MISDHFLSLLVCPMGKVPLKRDGDDLICSHCGTRFAIKDNIPNMIIEEAQLPEGCMSLADLACVKEGLARVEVA